MALNEHDLERLQKAVHAAAEVRKKVKARGKTKTTPAQMRLNEDDKASKLKHLYSQTIDSIQKNCHIKPSRTGESPSKAEHRKGNNANLGVDGIVSEGYRKDVIKKSKQFVKYCYQRWKIESLGDLKPHMVGEYLRNCIDSGIAPRTLGTYITALKKFGECNEKIGLKNHSNLVNKHHEALKNEHQYKKSERTRGKKADGSGMSLREARIIHKHAGIIGDPLQQAMVGVLIEAGPRISELMKLKWEHFDFVDGTMDMTQKNMNKNGRPRIISEFSEKTLQDLKDIWDSGIFRNPNQTIWGSHFRTEKNVREFIQACCRSGKVAYLGVHAFRNATKELQKKNLDKMEKKMPKDEFKKHCAEKILHHVSASEKLNPMIQKTQKVYEPVVDKNGKPVLKKDGTPKMKLKTENKGGKNVAVRVPVVDEAGKPVMVRKFNMEDLLDHRPDWLKNQVLTQMFGHNRNNVISEY